MESTLSSSLAKCSLLNYKTCSPSLILTRPFPTSSAAFPSPLNSFISLQFLSPFACKSINSPSAAADQSGDVSPDVILLRVTGMTCGGCSASVKRILESQPQVSSANVNLTEETAIIWPVPEAMSFPNWREQLGELLAKHLSSCGFTSYIGGDTVQEGDSQLQ